MLKSNFCSYSYTYILVIWTTLALNTTAVSASTDIKNKYVVLKNSAPFTDCINETNNWHINNAKDIDVVIRMYNFMKYSNIYSKICARLLQNCRYKLVLNDSILYFAVENSCFKF